MSCKGFVSIAVMFFIMQQFVYQSVEMVADVYGQAYASVMLGGQDLGAQ